ncbi:hypothetical protein J6590_060938 [Homalodisca vitripennis]|nr:hypothetical protein J6590_060938 [Homalodisca vitripennis]
METLTDEQIEDILDNVIFEDLPEEDASKVTDVESDGEEVNEPSLFDKVFSEEISKQLKKQRRYGHNEVALRNVVSELDEDILVAPFKSVNVWMSNDSLETDLKGRVVSLANCYSCPCGSSDPALLP